MIKKLIFAGLTITSILSLTACNKLDVIGSYSEKSFDAIINEAGDRVTKDTGFGGWALEAPDGGVRFLWSEDFSKTTEGDIRLELDVSPFVNAGLDVSLLPEGMLAGDKIVISTELGQDSLTYEGEASPSASYKQIVNLYRDNINYHMSLDHFGVDFMNGYMFEWAKDMSTNDKDIVFVLDPEVFIKAGVDPEKVEGWVFAKVETMDEKNKTVEVHKFLKPFDLDGEPVK